MKTYIEQVAEAVRDACESLHETDDVLAPIGNSAYGEAYQDGWIEGTEAYRAAIQTADIPAIIASVPAPEPCCVPGGWQLVPKEPTNSMIKASWDCAGVGFDDKGQRQYIAVAYHSMLAAAPQPPAQPVNKQLLDALKHIVEINHYDFSGHDIARKAIAAAEQQAQPEPLTDAEIDKKAKRFCGTGGVEDYRSFARAILAAAEAKRGA